MAGYLGGAGAVIFPDLVLSSSVSCYEASHFAAYKCDLQGATSFFKSFKVAYTNMTMFYNKEGVGPYISMRGEDEYKQLVM